MFRVDLDPLEAAAIERRRKLEEDRKRRIFDPKQRQLGVRNNKPKSMIIFNRFLD